MAAEVADVAELDGEVVARLPLDVEGVVDGVGQLVGAVVDAERDRLAVVDQSGSAIVVVDDAVGVGKVVGEVGGLGVVRDAVLQGRAVGVGEVSSRGCWGAGGRPKAAVAAAGGDVVVVERLRDGGAGGGVDEGQLLVDAEGAAGDGADGVAGREVAEELAAVVVHAGAGADDDLVVEHLRLPGGADARGDAPLAAGQGGVADAGGAVGVVAGDDEAGVGDGVLGQRCSCRGWGRS